MLRKSYSVKLLSCKIIILHVDNFKTIYKIIILQDDGINDRIGVYIPNYISYKHVYYIYYYGCSVDSTFNNSTSGIGNRAITSRVYT